MNTNPTPIAQLTSREIEVLRLITQGRLNKETASELGISIKTVEKHRQNLATKLQVYGTVGLTHFAIHSGLIQCNPRMAMA
jgi:DNA-binding NarL/FixJ family response regulator